MIYHCVACPGGPCHALNGGNGCASTDLRYLRMGLCAQGHKYAWVECDCKAAAEDEEDRRVDGGLQVDPATLALFQAEIFK